MTDMIRWVRETLPVPKNVSLTVVIVYIIYALSGLATAVEALREPPTAFFSGNLDVYWVITGLLLFVAGLMGSYGALTGEWNVERPSLVVVLVAVTIQTIATFAVLSQFGIYIPVLVLIASGTYGHLFTRWFRINSDYRDPTKDQEALKREKKGYLDAVNRNHNR